MEGAPQGVTAAAAAAASTGNRCWEQLRLGNVWMLLPDKPETNTTMGIIPLFLRTQEKRENRETSSWKSSELLLPAHSRPWAHVKDFSGSTTNAAGFQVTPFPVLQLPCCLLGEFDAGSGLSPPLTQALAAASQPCLQNHFTPSSLASVHPTAFSWDPANNLGITHQQTPNPAASS